MGAGREKGRAAAGVLGENVTLVPESPWPAPCDLCGAVDKRGYPGRPFWVSQRPTHE